MLFARDANGDLAVLIADMKSSPRPTIEHRLQVAFYAEMVRALFAAHEIVCARLETAILYRGPAATEHLAPDEAAKCARDRATAVIYLDAMLAAEHPAPDGQHPSYKEAIQGFARAAAGGPEGYRTLARLHEAALDAQSGDRAAADLVIGRLICLPERAGAVLP